MPSDEKKKGVTCFVFFLRLLKVLAVITLLLNITAYCLSIKASLESDARNRQKAFVLLAAVGFILFCIMLIICEFEPKWFIKYVYIFHYWFGRGFALVWNGVNLISTVKQVSECKTLPKDASIDPETVETVGEVTGWILISVGALYVLMSVLCIRQFTGEKEDDLEVGLINASERSSPSGISSGNSSPGVSAADELLMMNMALAMGMDLKDCKRRFGGKDGGKEAERYVKDSVKAKAGAAGSAAAGSAYSAASTASSNAAAYQPPTPPDAGGASTNNRDEEMGRKKMADDDELERAYYDSKGGDDSLN